MKSRNKSFWLISFFLLTMTFNTPLLAIPEGGYDLDAIMKVMTIVTVIFIAFLLWLAIVYSERNDNNGSFFLNPLIAFKRYMMRATPIEKEQEILLDHDYDGIRELDNKIPPWFNFLFYGTILFGIIYMLVFHVFGNGQVEANEYKQEMQQAAMERQILIKTGAFLNEETVTLLTDAAALNEGKEIFKKNCIACHGQNAEGIVGPNLTDDYWIHGGGIKNIFKTIKYGVPAKGMISWQTQLDPKKIQDVASYVISLHGTNPPNAKPPQGTKWEESKTDSVKTVQM